MEIVELGKFKYDIFYNIRRRYKGMFTIKLFLCKFLTYFKN